jgi:poly-gamma-glutamate biosynthesis protein PgsC/CapC
MSELLPLSVGLGLAVSLLLGEIFGITAGGMIVPGYMALCLTSPTRVILTIAGGLVTFLVVRTLSSFLILYGRRRTVLMILVGYLVAMAVRWGAHRFSGSNSTEHEMVGYIIPGLIALWLDRQGIIETLSALISASVVVRLLLVLVVGTELTR